MKECKITIFLPGMSHEIRFNSEQQATLYPVIRKKNMITSVFTKKGDIISYNLSKELNYLTAERLHEMMYLDDANCIYFAIDESTSMWFGLKDIIGVQVETNAII